MCGRGHLLEILGLRGSGPPRPFRAVARAKGVKESTLKPPPTPYLSGVGVVTSGCGSGASHSQGRDCGYSENRSARPRFQPSTRWRSAPQSSLLHRHYTAPAATLESLGFPRLGPLRRED